MKKSIIVFVLMISATLAVHGSSAPASQSKTIRATALTTELINKVMSGEVSNVTVEFKGGDRLPVVFTAEGDLLETSESEPSYWRVKRDFYVRLEKKQVLMSLDGNTYKPFKQVITGDITLNATADQNDSDANAINLNLKALLK